MSSLKTFSAIALIGSLTLASAMPANAECWAGANHHVFCNSYGSAESYDNRRFTPRVTPGQALLAISIALLARSVMSHDVPDAPRAVYEERYRENEMARAAAYANVSRPVVLQQGGYPAGLSAPRDPCNAARTVGDRQGMRDYC